MSKGDYIDDIDLINRATAAIEKLSPHRVVLAMKSLDLVAAWGWLDSSETSDGEPHLSTEAIAVLDEIIELAKDDE